MTTFDTVANLCCYWRVAQLRLHLVPNIEQLCDRQAPRSGAENSFGSSLT